MKQEIRDQMKRLRANITPEEIEDHSKEIYKKLVKSKLLNGDKFFIYLEFCAEVKTQKIISMLLNKGKEVYVPRMKNKEMFAVKFKSDTKLKKNKIGIFEPMGRSCKINDFIAIIPCLAVDKNGNRIGFGSGCYDKFLANKTVKKIAICYDFQLVDEIEPSEFDVPMDYIVTEKQIIEVSK